MTQTFTVQAAILNCLDTMRKAGVTNVRRAAIHAMITPGVFNGDTYAKSTSAFNYAVKQLMRAAKIEKHTYGRETRYSLV